MGLMDSLYSGLTGTIMAVILSVSISAIWIQFAVLDNTDIFTLGGLTKILIGLIPLFYALGVIRKMMKETEDERNTFRQFGGE